MSKSIIVYYSHSGNTKKGAKFIQSLVGADILELVPVKKYPSGLWETVDEFKVELEKDLRREVEAYQVNFNEYETVFIGTPNWGDTVATPLLSLFDKENLKEKKIMPFVTHGGGGVGRCAKDIGRLSGTNTCGKPLVYTGGSVSLELVKSWLKEEKCL